MRLMLLRPPFDLDMESEDALWEIMGDEPLVLPPTGRDVPEVEESSIRFSRMAPSDVSNGCGGDGTCVFLRKVFTWLPPLGDSPGSA
mmetsp:Transcript_444/g.687  ORF Transcript_444/g.687 Transcript_444/m.687 type:complete len:87 (+) Transcript_444:86-346(+)